MAENLGDLLKSKHLRQLPEAVPKEMTITGLFPGTQLSEILVALWTDTNWCHTFFDNIGAAYIDRSAPYSTTPISFNKAILATHGQYDTLHLILPSRGDKDEATSSSRGVRLGRAWVLTPMVNATHRFPPGWPRQTCRHISHTQEPTSSSCRLHRQLPLQVEGAPRERCSGLSVALLFLVAPTTLAMWADPLMTEVIPEGASPSATSTSSLALRTSLFAQNSWITELQALHGPILTTWTRKFIRSPLSQPCVCLISATPLVTLMDNVTTRSSTNASKSPEYESAHQSYCARAILARPIRRTWKPLSSPPCQHLYDTYFQRAVPSTSTSSGFPPRLDFRVHFWTFFQSHQT